MYGSIDDYIYCCCDEYICSNSNEYIHSNDGVGEEACGDGPDDKAR